MKKLCAGLLCLLLLLTSCAPRMHDDDEVVQKKGETKQEKSIVPSYQLSEDTYKMILPYKTSAARGVILDQMGNRLDIDEMEEGLRRQSKTVYDPKKYFYQEGQYLDKDTVYDLIDDLNPKKDPDGNKKEKEKYFRDHPRYLSHIMEQNYLSKNDKNNAKLEGISIGLALKSVYKFQAEEGGPYYYEKISKDEMLKHGKKLAEKVLKEIRGIDELKNVPILIALYREEDQGSPVPGNYVAKTTVKGNQASIDNWKNVKEEHVLFPDEKSADKYFDDNKLIEDFGKEIQDFFPNYVGVIGDGFYIDEDMKKLTLEIPIEFYGKGEVIGFTQYTYGLIKEMFPDYYDIEVKITAHNEVESVIYRSAGGDDPTVHIFD
ncbi:CamS family sex pheromone protein [Lentibacillus sp. N15]|uniref:CamS family sex pheromone protein n=1 Tax=Lentibacillus songyuanensis TaxID=3136161 RepID=UPI0031BBC464